MTLYWPRRLLAPRKVTPEPVYATGSGGRSITAVEQIVTTDAGYWQIVLDEIPLASTAQKKAWRAISVLLEGRYGTIAVPIYDYGAPWPTADQSEITGIPFSDQSLFSDESGFSQPQISATVNAAVALGAVTVAINLVYGDVLEVGQHFSVANQLYRIKGITSVVGAVTTLTVWPPVRVAMTAGSAAEFDDPRQMCRLATDGEMMTGIDDYAGRTLARVTFVEALPDPPA